jgi:hypothetical protein
MHGEPKYKSNQSDNKINVAKNKKGRLQKREPSAKKHCLPKKNSKELKSKQQIPNYETQLLKRKPIQ